MLEEGGAGIACRASCPGCHDGRAGGSASHVCILEAYVLHAAAEDSEETLVVDVCVLGSEVADNVSLTVEVDVEEVILSVGVQRSPVVHTTHVDVVVQNDVVHLALVHVFANLQQVLCRLDDEGIFLSTFHGSQCGNLVSEAVAHRINNHALLVEGGIVLAG